MGAKAKTPQFVTSFPQLFEARAFENNEPKFGVTGIFPYPDSDPRLQPLWAIARAAAHEKFGPKLPANIRWPFRDGKDKEGLEGFGPGKCFINMTSKQAPGVVDAQVQRIMDRSEIYAGIIGLATVTAYGYDQKGNKGVAFGLHNFQKVRDGQRIDGRAAAESDFEAIDTVGSGGADDEAFLS